MFDRSQQKLHEYEQRLVDVDDLFRRRIVSVTENAKSRKLSISAGVGAAALTCTIAVPNVSSHDNSRRSRLIREASSGGSNRRLSLPQIVRVSRNSTSSSLQRPTNSQQRRLSVSVHLPHSSPVHHPRPITDAEEEEDAGRHGDAELLSEVHSRHQELSQLVMSVSQLESSLVSERVAFNQSLQDASRHRQQLEQQLSELRAVHDTEMSGIRQTLMSLQEKMECQLDERTRHMRNMLESCHTKVARMYVNQQQQQQQQSVGVSDAEHSSSYVRVVGVKCLNVTLTALAVIFFLTSTASLLASHLTATRCRRVITLVSVLTVVALWHWH